MHYPTMMMGLFVFTVDILSIILNQLKKRRD